MGTPKTEILFLGKEDVDRLISWELVVDAVEAAFRSDGLGQMLTPAKEIMPMGGDNALFAMPGCLRNLGVAGVKWTNFYPQGEPGIPTIWGHVLVLSHTHNGQPFAILDATTITGMRTSGGHAVVAAKYLARNNARSLGIVGCGAQGCAAAASFSKHFPLDRLVLFDSVPEASKRLAQDMQGRAGEVLCTASPQEAAECDILLIATVSLTPVVWEKWLRPGCFVAAMFGFHDLDPAFSAKADKWVLGHRESDRDEILENEFYGTKLSPTGPYGTLGDVVCGTIPGRENDDERIVFTHMGMGALDVAVGYQLVEKAKELNVGQTLRLT